MATQLVRRRRLRELKAELRAAVSEVQWMADVWNAADRVAGRAGEIPYPWPNLPEVVPPAESGPAEAPGLVAGVEADTPGIRVGVIVR